MSDYSTNSTINLSVNGQNVEEKLKKYENQLVELRKKAQNAAEIGDKGSLQKTQKEIIKVEQQMRKVRTATANVEDTLQNLDKARPTNLKKDLNTLKSQLNGLERGSDAWNAHIEKIKLLQAELKKVNSELKSSEGFWESFNRKMNDWQTTIAAGAAAVTGMVMAGRSAVNAYADMDSEMANVRKFTGLADEEVKELNEDFMKIDTRTSREQLNELAQEAGRLGKTSKEDVLGFVKAADQINVALDDLGSDATLSLSKLTNIFGDEKIYGTEASLLKVGSVINELSQNCTASAPYLSEFAQRLAGVGAQANMTIPQIMSFAAVLDSQGQAVEMSATALSKLIMDLFKDPAKIAKATGLDLDELNNKLKESTNEGLIMLLDRLHELGNIDVLAPVFADMGEDGARASGVISALAGNIDTLKWEQEEANEAFQEGTSVTNEFNVQNNTVAAGLDKAKKGVTEMAVQLGEQLQPIMSHVISSTTLLMKLMSQTITFVSNNATALATLVASFVAFKIAVNASNIAFKAHYAWIVTTEAATKVYKGTLAACKSAVLLLQIAMAKLNGNAARQSALMLDLKKQGALVASGYGVIAAAAIALGVIIYKVIQRMNEQSAAEKALMDIKQKASDQVQDQVFKIQQLLKVARDETASLVDRKEAIKQLNEIIPGYNASLDETTGKYTESTKAVNDYIEALTRQYEIEGAKDKLKEIGRQKADLKIQNAYDEQKKKQLNKSIEKNAKDASKQTAQPAILAGTGTSAQVSMNTQGNTNLANYAKLGAVNNRINNRNQQIKDLDAQTAAITGAYGKEIAKSVVKDNKSEDSGNGNGGNGGSGEGSGSGSASKKTNDKFADEKAWKAEQLALNRIAYATGEKDYQKYQDDILNIDAEYNQKILARQDLTNQERLDSQADYAEDQMILQQSLDEQTKEDVDNHYADLKAIEDQRYIDGKLSTEQYNNALNQLELKHLSDIVNIYKDGSKEKEEAIAKYEQAILEDQKKRRKKEEELEKEHQKKLEEIRKGVFSNTPTSNKSEYESQIAALNEVYQQELIAAEGNAKQKLAIEEAYQKAKQALAYKYNQVTLENGFNQMQVMNADIMNWLESDAGQTMLGTMDTVMSGMSSIFSQCSDLVQSELEIETAAIESRYEKEISAAEGNKYKVNKIEKEKEKETAKAKNAANKKLYAMQVMQAIASTAQGAINAYTSAAQVPMIGYILAPIAAATAVAAGMLQVAAIKKQQQASEAQGYAEGGYTPKGSKYEPKGVVHAGEWVASQKLLANPQAAAIIQSLDYAQKTNTIGSISASQVSGDVTAAASVARMTEAGQSDTSSDNNVAESIKELNERLKEPFITVNTVEGDNGIKKAQDDYDKYIKNKTPKNRR